MLTKLMAYKIGALGCVCSLLISMSAAAQTATPADPTIVAKIQGTVITQDELQKYAAKDLEQLNLEKIQFEVNFERNKHQVLENDLSRLLADKLLKAESERRGITVDQLLAKELQGKVKEPTEDDVKAYYEANKQRINQPLLQIGSQIYQYLKTENYNQAKAAYVEQLKQTHDVTVELEPLRANVETDGSPAEGPAGAPVTVVEFSDFQCPYCARMFDTLHGIMQKYGTQVRLVYRNFPLVQIHPYAEKAAEAGLCAADQGHFWEMHDLMFQAKGRLTEDDLRAKAALLKLDMNTFNACMNSGQHAAKIKQDVYAGSKLGVSGTPALFINGRFIQGAVPIENITKLIDEELKSAEQLAKNSGSAIK